MKSLVASDQCLFRPARSRGKSCFSEVLNLHKESHFIAKRADKASGSNGSALEAAELDPAAKGHHELRQTFLPRLEGQTIKPTRSDETTKRQNALVQPMRFFPGWVLVLTSGCESGTL